MITRIPKNNLGAGLSVLKVSAIGLTIAGMSAVVASAAPTLSGSVEAGYNYNLSIPTDSMKNILHSMDFNSKTFTLNNAHLVLSGSDSATGLGYDVETDLGSDAKADKALDASLGAADVIDLQEAYLTWAFGPGRTWGLKAGKFVTYQGIEVVEGGANPTVTRGLLFGLAEPVSHTGLVVSDAVGKIDVNVGLINGWDQLNDNNSMPSIVGKLGVNLGDPLALTISTIIGPEQAGSTNNKRMSFDATGLTKVLPMVDLWFQGNYGMEDKVTIGTGPTAVTKDATWFGFGLQPLVHLNAWFGLGLRYEFFSDADGARTGLGIKDLTVQDVSLAPTIWLTKATMVRGEFRMDFASKDIFQDKNKKAAGSQAELAADFVTNF